MVLFYSAINELYQRLTGTLLLRRSQFLPWPGLPWPFDQQGKNGPGMLRTIDLTRTKVTDQQPFTAKYIQRQKNNTSRSNREKSGLPVYHEPCHPWHQSRGSACGETVRMTR